MARFVLGLVLLMLIALLSCVNPPEYPVEPVIKYEGVNKTRIAQGNSGALRDTLAIQFSFTDGDGDLGFESDSVDIYLTDSREGFEQVYRLPFLPRSASANGISGTVTVRIYNQPFNICCIYPDGSQACQPNSEYPVDTFSYFIQIRDRANHFSNKIQTETITILCN